MVKLSLEKHVEKIVLHYVNMQGAKKFLDEVKSQEVLYATAHLTVLRPGTRKIGDTSSCI